MKQERIQRINQLYHKSQTPDGLSREEKEEQERLRKEYIADIRTSLRGNLNNISIRETDGSITDLGKKHGGADAKKKLRREMLTRRDTMDAGEINDLNSALWKQMEACPALWDGRTIYTYISYRQEADTLALIRKLWDQGLPVAAPRVSGQQMAFYQIRSQTDIRLSSKGIPEPGENCALVTGERGLVVVPGAVFDARGYRIGYGGGFYDRFLEANPGLDTMGLAYDFQVIDSVPAQAFDLPVASVLTPSGIIKCNSSDGSSS